MLNPLGPRVLLAMLLAATPYGDAAAQQPPEATASGPAAGRSLFLFLYRPGPAWVQGRPMREQELRPHGAYFRRLLEEGRVFAGGGYVGDDGGMAIVRAASHEEAQALLDADPAIRSGVFEAELRQWAPRFTTEQPLIERPR